jgi:hypothetical protein
MKNRLCPISTGKRKYALWNPKDGTTLEVIATSKAEACKQAGVNPRHYQVLTDPLHTVEVLFHTNLTNAEVINFLSRQDPNAPCEIMCDFATDHQSRMYDPIEPKDGVCIDTSTGTLFFSMGECW